jgi:hypothetical protein
MKSLSPFVVLAGMIGGAFACGDSATGPSAASVTGIAGDNQSAPTGAQLAFPLTFTALGSDGLPIEGVSVSWSVTPAGRATFSARTSRTDTNGVASTNVTFGITPGAITLQAAVAGISPVVYHATILDPCMFATSLAVGESVNASLATSDCHVSTQIGTFLYDFYELVLPPGQQNLRISMRSTAFDTYVDFYDLSGEPIAFDDDSILVQEQNSQLDIVLPGDTTYIIGANSYNPFTTGPYALSASMRPVSMNGCRQVWVVSGVSISDSITTGDCADSTASPRGYDVARILLFSSSVLTLSVRSTALNPTLALYRLGAGDDPYFRTLVASNDDSLPGSNTNAFISYTQTATSVYDILIGTSVSGETGAYTFEFSASTTASPRISGPVSRGRGSWWRDAGLLKRSKH